MKKMKTTFVVMVAFALYSCAGPKVIDPVALGPDDGWEDPALSFQSDLDEDVSLTQRNQRLQEGRALQPVYFGYDSFEIEEDQAQAIADCIIILRENPSSRVLLEGHCDERGTFEYNFALGEKRALAVREAFVWAGIESSRIDHVSYGEDRPAYPGSGEGYWSKNRRVEMKILD